MWGKIDNAVKMIDIFRENRDHCDILSILSIYILDNNIAEMDNFVKVSALSELV